MIVLYAVLAISTIIVLVVAIGLFVRVRRLSRASESQFRRLVRDEETAVKTGTDPR
ncbi:MAG: hypothetical protein L0Z53_20380 [Acidobacteriales bacterium]|nr:hypothetical protein [Terriglobales bacterium]